MRRGTKIFMGVAALALLLGPWAYASQELASNILPTQVIKPQSSSTTVTSAAIDVRGFDEVVVTLDCGTTAATGTLDVKVQSSATSGGTYADITGAAFVQVTPSNDDAIYVGRIRVNPSKPFLKVVAAAATAASLYSVHFDLGGGVKPRPLQTPVFNKSTTD